MAPCEIVPALADEGIYITSESTFYRVLREEKMLNHRGRSEAPKHNRPSTYSATAPNQVYRWDITYLNGPHKGMFYYLYLFSDLYDRGIVGWEVYEEESADYASSLIKRICLKQGRLTTEPLVLHSDNGSPMKGATMLATLYQLGITPSNSRPCEARVFGGKEDVELYCWKNGKLKVVERKGRAREILYCHYQKRNMTCDRSVRDCDEFVIVPNAIMCLDHVEPTLYGIQLDTLYPLRIRFGKICNSMRKYGLKGTLLRKKRQRDVFEIRKKYE